MQVISRTHVGLVRENNEDALLVREPSLFAVADGMGGYAAGEIASRSTIKAFEAATTMTALYLPGDGHGYCCHVGDSRLYLFRNDKLEQLTHDHTLVADLKEQGKITDEEAFVHPQRNILLQALGVEETVNADFFSFRLQEGDRLLLCSDGLSDMLRAAEISRIIGCADPEQAADKLLAQSLDNGGRDNVSLILIDLTTQGEESCNG